MNYEKAVENIRQELKIYIVKYNLKSLVIGISGGIDSALCAVLAKPICDELNIKLIGRSLPVMDSNKQDEIDRAKKIGEVFCTNFKEIELAHFTDLMEAHFEVWEDDYLCEGNDYNLKIRNGNIRARTRMIYLYNLASKTSGMVLSTDNYTEYLLGFFTLHGDQGDYGMIQNLWKTEVYNMTEWIRDHQYWDEHFKEREILTAMLQVDATDGLGISNTDLDQILPGWKGSSRDGYKEVDKKLQDFINLGTADLDDPVIYRHLNTEFKRNNPFNIPRNKIDI